MNSSKEVCRIGIGTQGPLKLERFSGAYDGAFATNGGNDA
jgi:hypothetical protein